jgi:hypothetical protein
MIGNFVLRSQSLQIAVDYLERSREIDDRTEAVRFLSRAIELMMQEGIIHRSVLSNVAISAIPAHQTSSKRPRT